MRAGMKWALRAGVLSAAAVSLLGQTGQVAGPVTGFVFDRAGGALRPILGIPGASVVGNALPLGYGIVNAAIAPKQDSAFVVARDGSLHLLRLQAGSALEAGCTVCPSTAESAIFSPSGTAAAVYAAGRVQILTGLAGTPAAGATFSIGPAEAITTHGVRYPGAGAPPMALSDDGQWLLAGTKDSVVLYNANGGPRQLMQTQSYPSVAFAPGGHDAAIADSRAGVVWIHDVTGVAAEQQVAPGTPARRFSGIAFSADGSRILAAMASEGVISVDLASATSTSTSCGCNAAELVPMGSVVRLNELGDGPLWLFDGRTAQPRVVFVPAVAAAQ